MQTFTDKNDKVWSFEINLATAEDVAAYDFSKITDEKVDIIDFANQDAWNILQKPLVVAEIVWALMASEYPAADQPATRRTFLSGLNATKLRELLKLFMGELGNFYPHLETLFSKLTLQVDKTHERSCAMLDRVLQDMKDEMPLSLEKMEADFWREYQERLKKFKEESLQT